MKRAHTTIVPKVAGRKGGGGAGGGESQFRRFSNYPYNDKYRNNETLAWTIQQPRHIPPMFVEFNYAVPPRRRKKRHEGYGYKHTWRRYKRGVPLTCGTSTLQPFRKAPWHPNLHVLRY